MGRFLYFLVMLLLARVVLRAILSAASASRQHVGASSSPPSGPVHKGTMVRDPVCGLHVPQSQALVSAARGKDGRPVYFCSETCRRAYAEQS